MAQSPGRFIEHGFGKLPNVISKDRLDELVTRLKESTITKPEIKELVDGHLKLALWTAAKYAKYAEHLSQDLLGEAAYGLMKALSLAPQKLQDSEITAFITVYMKKYVRKLLSEDNTIPIPLRSLKRHQRSKIVITNDLEDIIDPQKKLNDLRETIYAAVKYDFEREVIHLRELGLNDQEVAEKLSCSREKVGQAKRKVYQRFLQA